MTFRKTASELADLVQGKLEGDSSIVITGLAGLRESQEGQISFLEHNRYAAALATSKASVILVNLDAEVPQGRTVIRVKSPSTAFGKIVTLITPPPITHAPGIHPQASVSKNATVDPSASVLAFAVVEGGAKIGKKSVIGAGCYIGHEAVIGDDCFLYANVNIRERCVIGNSVILHHGAVVGSDGFGYDFTPTGYQKIPQIGIVQIDDNVEIGANTCIDRGRFGKTWIQKGCKIDNLVQIAHNVIIGENTAIAAQAGISGSTVVGKLVRVAGQVGTVGHITIGDGSVLMAQSGINHDVPKGQMYFGYPAQEHREAMKTHAHIRRLPYLVERVKALEKKLEELTKQDIGS
jgi:UDP-3-O-[3-hydroxymyristoyl] glucosamine N-acyltransferase